MATPIPTTIHPGVTLLSSLVAFNQSLPSLDYVVDVEGDLFFFFIVAVPFISIWILGIGFVSYHTDDDGYLSGVRSVEGQYPVFRFINQVLCYGLEMLQLMACAFGKGATEFLIGGTVFHDFSNRFLWNQDFKAAFAGSAIIYLALMILMVIPTALWFSLKRETFKKFLAWYRHGALGSVVSFIQDCYMIWLVIPVSIQLLRGIPCTYYTTGEPATALGDTELCMSSIHLEYGIAGGVIFTINYAVGVTAGSVPALVGRKTDIALNGRFVSISYAIKQAIAVSYVVAANNHPIYHLSTTLFLQLLLLFISISLRPCLVERINFHRSAAYTLSIIPTVMCLVATIMADGVAVLPIASGMTFLGAGIVLIFAKYYWMVCGKLLPEIPYKDGKYRGDLNLGHNLPHGQGTLDFTSRRFTGRFIFGEYDGYGVEIAVAESEMTEAMVKAKKTDALQDDEEFKQEMAKEFFNGHHKGGKREGFGTTNVMLHEGEMSYEGFWHDDKYNGAGTKKWKDGDTLEGTFIDNFENGLCKWSFETSLGPHEVDGEWENGIYLGVQLTEDELYEGDVRYGVPHGEGEMRIGDIVFNGEWRAGKMHGLGTVNSPEGHYDGNFLEGEYHDFGTWTDDTSVYAGKFKNGLKHGHGREESEDGVYEGMFEEGERHGYGTFNYSNGSIYQGSWRNGEYYGTGYQKTDEFEFDGVWMNGQRHGGRGHIEYTNGEEYLGGWHNDMMQGNGILRLPGLGEFHGVFDNGNKVGQGRFNFEDGSEYVGNFEEDRAEGEGKFIFNSRKTIFMMQSMNPDDDRTRHTDRRNRYFLDFGGTYTGDFHEGEFCGKGKVTTSEGAEYEGEWAHSLPEGFGILVYFGGGEYRGEFHNGERHGTGRMEYVDTRSYEGEWQNGQRHGQGTLRAANDEILHDGDWADDQPVVQKELKVEVEIPTVDVDEFLQAIMPAASSATEVDEGRARKRLELEEIADRVCLSTWLEEELFIVRVAKNYFFGLQTFGRNEIIAEEAEVFRATQKSALGKILNMFKAQFRYENDREPKKSDLVNNRFIAPIYRRYQEISKK